MTIPQLENLLKRRQEQGRVYAGFLLRSIGLSADVEIYICVPTGDTGEKSCDHKVTQQTISLGEQLTIHERSDIYTCKGEEWQRI